MATCQSHLQQEKSHGVGLLLLLLFKMY